MCVCACVRACVRACIHVCVCVRACVYVVYVVYVCVCVCVHACIHACVCRSVFEVMPLHRLAVLSPYTVEYTHSTCSCARAVVSSTWITGVSLQCSCLL